MSEIAQTHIWALARALGYLLGPGESGALAFVRCLPAGVLPALLTPDGLTIPEWNVYGVGASSLPAPAASRVISADKAVEIREEKKGSALLLVDPRHVGAGMDGIYSAGREIREDVLLTAAIEEVERGLPRGYKGLVGEAKRQGRRLLGKAILSPWIEFLFCGYCCEAPEKFGELVTLLGLWPVTKRDSESRVSKEDLEVSAQIVARLLLVAGAESTPQARVASLFLPEDQAEERSALEVFLAEMAGLRWTDAVRELRARPGLWLNRIRPGFIGESLVAIELDAWRARPDGALHAWSGLKLVDGQPTFLVPEEQRTKAKLQVRWRTVPRELPAGSLTYEVTVVTGAGHQLAARQVSHSGKGSFQRCILTVDDFEDVEDGGKWEAFVQVHPTGHAPPKEDEAESQTWTKTEDFVITFGPSDTAKKTTAGRRVRALVEEAINLPVDQFLEACNAPRTQDSHGFVSLRVGQRGARVHRPALLRSVEESWQENDLQIGRWTVRVRDDGSRVGDIAFQPLEECKGDLDAWRKLQETTRSLGRQVLERLGFVGVIYHQTEAADRYVNAWAAALETAAPQLALAHTIEVQRVSGQPVGLIVLPSHPIRVAWHQAYDELAYHARYVEEIPSAEVVRTLAHLAGSHFPMFLPGLAGKETFVFGDMLGFMAVAMMSAREPEPQAAVAHLARALSQGRDSTAASVGMETSEIIAGEIARYAEVHRDYTTLHVSAVRAGDAFTTARALGSALGTVRGSTLEEETDLPGGATHLSAFRLDLFPSHTIRESGIVGRFLSETVERRRSGAGTVDPEDVWITERVDISGVAVPKLMWSKRRHSDPDLPAHLAIAFDTFNSDVIGLPSSERPTGRPIEAYGLAPSIVRSFSLRPVPRWRSAIAAEVEGTKHPAGRGLTDRLQRLHANVMSVVAINLGHPPDWWPFLGTEITADRADSLNQLHQLTDWVLTVDRNMGLEYFDSPRDAPEIYDTYVIDSVPERHDLDCVQLVTSTVHVDEVLRLLDRGLTEMGLSFSPRHCSFLLSHLKALSGRLAMRFTHLGNRHRELIALALFHANCQERGEAPEWLSAADGFFVPLDDIRDLVPSSLANEPPRGVDELEERVTDQAELRADLAYVSLSKRGALRISFVEIKYRRLLRTAVAGSVLEQVARQLRSSRQLWRDTYSSQHLRPTQLVIRRRKLARAFRFYCDKARRHRLASDLYERLCAAIDRLHDPETDLWSESADDRAYVFCPEHTGSARQLADDDGSRILLFGPLGTLPLPQGAVMESVEPASAPDAQPTATMSPNEPAAEEAGPAAASSASVATNVGKGGDEARPLASEAGIGAPVLGHTLSSGTPVVWPASIRGNPHLMIVGRPGMGKTTSIVSLCEQLLSGGLNPIVFSFHPDLEARLDPLIGPLLYVDIGGGLGFNPLRVVTSAPHGWIDTVGMVRDIFAAIYPDLGEIQTNELRAAIKQSYEELGYGVSPQSEGLRVPSLERFYEILRQKQKPNKGLLARLDELSDYGLFRISETQSSLLAERRPVLIRLHTTPNEVVQNFVASFVLFSIYQAMFLRGEQPALSHVVVVDEAHRASRLKLLPTMAKECRKFGLSLVVASQEAKDFHASLFAAVVSYLVLNVADADAQILARYLAPPGETARIASELRSLAKFTGYFFSEGRRPSRLRLRDPYQPASSVEPDRP